MCLPLPLFCLFFFPGDFKPKAFLMLFNAIPQSHYFPIIPLSNGHHGLLSKVFGFYLHLTSVIIKMCVIFFISALFQHHFQGKAFVLLLDAASLSESVLLPAVQIGQSSVAFLLLDINCMVTSVYKEQKSVTL